MNYPISLEDYEKKVYELFKEVPSGKYTPQQKEQFLKDFIKEDDPYFMERAYSASCGIYSQNINLWKEIGMSDDEILERFMSYPIHNLTLILL